MEQGKCVYVLSDVDGYKYKLVVSKGNLDTLGTRKIKRYLEKAAHVPLAQQVLTFAGKVLTDELSGKDIGLADGSILFLQKETFAQAKAAPSTSVVRSTSHGDSSASGRRVTGQGSVSSCSIEYASGRTTLTQGAPAGNAPKERLSRYSQNEGLDESQEIVQQRVASPRDATSASSAQAHNQESRCAPSPSALERQSDQCSPYHKDGEGSWLAHSDTDKGSAHGSTGAEQEEKEGYGSDDSPLLQRPSDQQEEQQTAAADNRREHRLRDREARGASLDIEGGAAGRSSPMNTLEEENATLRKENRILSQHLKSAERRLANNDGDARLHEKVKALQREMEHMKAHYLEMIAEQEEKWILKEEEFVRELDLLREERRRTKAEGSRFESEQQKLTCELESEIRSRARDAEERNEEVRSLRRRVEELQQQLRQQAKVFAREQERPTAASAHRARHDGYDDDGEESEKMDDASLETHADNALQAIGHAFHIDRPLSFDPANHTCVIDVETEAGSGGGADTLSLLVTVDYTTERVYLYNALLHSLPEDPATRLELYETLLQGALLGKDMAGGGVGISTESGMVLMSVFMDLRHGDRTSLASLAKPFLRAAELWAETARSIVSIDA